jgi:hypothetical protein
LNFFILKKIKIGSLEMGQGFWENGCTTPPFFEATLGSANSSKLHGEWRFHFFQKHFSKFRAYLDLHIYCWDFVS